MKATELKKNLFPPREVVRAYDEVGQEYERTIHDRGYETFHALVTADPVKNQEIEKRISHLYRLKDANGEWLYYHVLLRGNDWQGNRKDFSYREGKIDGMPLFERRIDPATHKVIPESTQIHEMKTVYTIPFTKQKVDEISKYFVEPIEFIVIDRTGKRYSCSLEEFRDLPYEELIKQKTSWMFTDFYRNKQLLEAGQGGITK